jgi:hypothetical protein
LKELESEDGMLLGIPDFTNFRIRGTIAGVCADTMGGHEIGGFFSPSANRFCRLCLITREKIKQKSCFDQFEMRTRENYDEAVEASASNPEKASETGIRSCCVRIQNILNFISEIFNFRTSELLKIFPFRGELNFRCHARFLGRRSFVYDQTFYKATLFVWNNKNFCNRIKP